MHKAIPLNKIKDKVGTIIKGVKRNKRDLCNQREAIIYKFKDVPCTDCNTRYPQYIMDFHHRNPEEKEAPKGLRSLSLSKLMIEILKCDVLCSNCHRKRHHKMRQNLKTLTANLGG